MGDKEPGSGCSCHRKGEGRAALRRKTRPAASAADRKGEGRSTAVGWGPAFAPHSSCCPGCQRSSSSKTMVLLLKVWLTPQSPPALRSRSISWRWSLEQEMLSRGEEKGMQQREEFLTWGGSCCSSGPEHVSNARERHCRCSTHKVSLLSVF